MHRFTRSVLVTLSVAVSLWPLAAGAYAQETPSVEPVLSVDQARSAFSNAGYQVEQAHTWDWTLPPVTSFQVRDPANDRVLMVMVYPTTNAAETARLQAESHDPTFNQEPGVTGPHLVTGYGASVWNGNVALVQTTESRLENLYQAQNDRDNGVYVDLRVVQDTDVAPYTAVDLDFRQALSTGAVNL